MRLKRWLAVSGGLVFAAGLAGGGAYLCVGAQALAGLAAKSTCTCVFVSERAEDVCTGDELEAQGIGFVPVTVDRAAGTVEARAFHLHSARARHRAETGCTLE